MGHKTNSAVTMRGALATSDMVQNANNVGDGVREGMRTGYARRAILQDQDWGISQNSMGTWMHVASEADTVGETIEGGPISLGISVLWWT